MAWLEARHVHDPGQPLYEALEQYVPEANMAWPLARSMYAALACEQAEPKATSYTLDGVVAMLKTSRGQDKLAWTIAQRCTMGRLPMSRHSRHSLSSPCLPPRRLWNKCSVC